MQDGVVYRGISPDVLMIDRKGRLQVGSVGAVAIFWRGLFSLHHYMLFFGWYSLCCSRKYLDHALVGCLERRLMGSFLVAVDRL